MDAAQLPLPNNLSDCQQQVKSLQATVTALASRLGELKTLETRLTQLTEANAELNRRLEVLTESEKRYRTLFELSNEGIYRFEINPPIPTSLSTEAQLEHAYQHYRLVEMNETFATQYGLTDPAQLVGKSIVDFYPKNSEVNLATNRAIIENGYCIRNAETEEIDISGKQRYFLQNIVCDVREEAVWGGWGTQTDITELKTAQVALMAERMRGEQAALDRTAELEQYNQQLAERDRILAAAAEVGNVLLTVENLDDAVNTALRLIGESLDTDRVGVTEHIGHSAEHPLGYWQIIYEWHSLNVPSQIIHPELVRGSYEGIEFIYELAQQGKGWGGSIEETGEPFRNGQEAIGVKSLYAIPIMIDGQYWGNIGFDDCRQKRYRSDAVLSILKTAATCIGGAIERARTRHAQTVAERAILVEREKAAQERATQLEQTNQVLKLREQWLEATANAANALLSEADLDTAINDALQILGEGIGVDRIGILRYYDQDSLGNTVGFVQLRHEWNSPFASSQLAHPELNKISLEGLEDFNTLLMQGEWIGGLIDEFPEPFRSNQLVLDVKSTYAVPILVNETLWGMVGIDHCREAKQLTPPEIAVFKTAARCVGGAIQRVQIQQAREEAERQMIEERTRLARDIHDTLAQAFTGVIIQLQAGQEVMTTQPDIMQSHLTRANELARQGLAEARRSVQAIRSAALVSGDLASALRQTAQQMTTGMTVQATLQLEGRPYALLPEIESNLFRIGQEALTNALKHAQPQTIQINLVYEPDAVHLQVIDDGQGFTPHQTYTHGFGLLGMQERAQRLGTQLSLISRPGEGTTLTVTVEVSNP